MRPNLFNRLFFAWFLLWGTICAVFFCTVCLIHLFFVPKQETFSFWAIGWGRSTLWGCGMRVKVIRLEKGTKQPQIFVSNHVNMADMLVHTGFIGLPFGFLAKVEVKNMPFIGWVLQKAGIFVDRSTPRKAVESIQEAAQLIQEGKSALIYPEGERTWSHNTVAMMKGAFDLAIQAQVPIVPMLILDGQYLVDERKYTAKPGKMTFIIGKAIPTTGLHRKEADKLIQQVAAFWQEQGLNVNEIEREERRSEMSVLTESNPQISIPKT